MLKPFRIRELLDASEDAAARKVGECEISRHGLDGVVRVTSSQYDETITSNPEARLSYVDEDDGESIMVSSILEIVLESDELIGVNRSDRHLNSRNVSKNLSQSGC